jgi:thiamine pyrophosphokinase
MDIAAFTICADGGANHLYELCEKSPSLGLEEFVRLCLLSFLGAKVVDLFVLLLYD